MTLPMFRLVDCRMDGCRCGQPHPAYRDCPICLGTGFFMGGDAQQNCPRCAREDRRAREAAEDRVDVEAKDGIEYVVGRIQRNGLIRFKHPKEYRP